MKGELEYHIEQPKEKCVCPCCKSKSIILKGKKERRFLSIPSGSKKVTIVLRVPRVYCTECNLTRQVAILFSEPMARYTRRLARYVLAMIEFATTLDVANHLDVSWGLIRKIEGQMLRKKYGKPRLREVKKIAIDEIINEIIDEIAAKKGLRWILLKCNENLNPLKGEAARLEAARLEAALRTNHDLYVAYLLKEELCGFWDEEDYDTAEGMLAYHDFNITTGPLEGLNNKIKTLKRQAYGFRDLEYFKLKIYAIHKTRSPLVG